MCQMTEKGIFEMIAIIQPIFINLWTLRMEAR